MMMMQDDEWKLRLLLRKLRTKEYQRYKPFILPKTQGDFTLTGTVAKLTDIFGKLSSLTHALTIDEVEEG